MAGYRPADWQPLDLDRDPTPGDPYRVRTLASQLHAFADDVSVGRIAHEVETGVLAGRLARLDGDRTQGIDSIEQRAWSLGNRLLLVGAVQDDTELPVRVDAVVS
ncbi:hypothetical protein [Streptomyces sp. NPDC101237]|uniref:hypothetical protein n=1 Tax=Streptomyces sp. NPDC101237 TaxID=3366139 RepID=UPI00381887E7